MSQPRARRIGVMGGTFDPIHVGHLVVAERAREACGLDVVAFVVAGDPWQKAARRLAPAEDRYTMTVLATASNPAFVVDRAELDRPGPSYTVDTLRQFRSRDPHAELFFLAGADAIADIPTWKDHDELFELATFVAATRPGHDLDRLDGLGPGARERVRVLDVEGFDVSSTVVRDRVASGGSVRYLVPDPVAGWIDKRGLYGGGCR